MAIVQAIFAFIGRSMGKILNTAFGWATVLLFGRVPQERQIYLSILTFGSVIWLLVLFGIGFPSFGTFMLAFIPLPQWVDRNYVRLAMLVAAILIPPIVGGVAILMVSPEDRPASLVGKALAVLHGYPLTLGLAVTLIMLIVFAPIMKLQDIVRRWSSQHVPVIVTPEDYFAVLAQLEKALDSSGWRVQHGQASWMLRLPTKIVTLLSGGSLKNFVAENLTVLRSDNIEVTLHPSDLIIRGGEADVVHTRALVAEQLAFSKAHMAWSKEAIALEDCLDGI